MFCTNCGNELNDQAVICPNCGIPTANYKGYSKGGCANKNYNLIKIFLIISCICSIFSFLIPLAWCLPLTISYCRKVERGEEITVGFKVCILIFVSLISGVLMLCDE